MGDECRRRCSVLAARGPRVRFDLMRAVGALGLVEGDHEAAAVTGPTLATLCRRRTPSSVWASAAIRSSKYASC